MNQARAKDLKDLKDPQYVADTRKAILFEATDLISSDGFDGLSMRKLATRVGMTAANLYNYYENKSELYLCIQLHGFEALEVACMSATATESTPLSKLEALMRAYIDFALSNPALYDVMLGRDTPKYSDFVGTSLEPLARTEKHAALRALDAAVAIAETIDTTRAAPTASEIRTKVIIAWSTLHGLVSLFLTRVMHEVTDDLQGCIDDTINHLLAAVTAAAPAPEN